MARPFRPPSIARYKRDVERLARLRTAMTLDGSLDPHVLDQAQQQIDALTRTLMGLASPCPTLVKEA